MPVTVTVTVTVTVMVWSLRLHHHLRKTAPWFLKSGTISIWQGCASVTAVSTAHAHARAIHIQTHIHAHTHTHTLARTHTRTHTRAHTHTHTHTHTRTHTRTHTHTHTHSLSPEAPKDPGMLSQQDYLQSVELLKDSISGACITCRVGQNHEYTVCKYGGNTVFLAGKSPNTRSYTVCIYVTFGREITK